MKKIIFSFLALILTISLLPMNGHAQEITKDSKESMSTKDLQEMKKALKETNLEIDMNNEKKVEEKVVNEKGEKIGTLGIEEVSSEPVYENLDDNRFNTFATTIPKGVNKRYKVYWYAATVNYHFHVTVNVSKKTGKGRIVSTDNGNYFVIPPGYVSNDVVTIPRRNETSKSAAEARYTLKMSAPVSIKLWINGKVKNGKFYTSHN